MAKNIHRDWIVQDYEAFETTQAFSSAGSVRLNVFSNNYLSVLVTIDAEFTTYSINKVQNYLCIKFFSLLQSDSPKWLKKT